MIQKYVFDFIEMYPLFRIKPTTNKKYIVEGTYECLVSSVAFEEILVKYDLSIHIPEDYPESLPTVFELSSKIKKLPENHVNGDGSLCLGAPIRLQMIMKNSKSLIHFFEECILPYLYAYTLKQEKGKPFVFGELAHGSIGLINDFKELFNLSKEIHVLYMLEILSMKKKVANRQTCPCGCGKRLTTCNYFTQVKKMRKLFPRSEWKKNKNMIKRGN